MELGKVPPHDTEAEQAVIGSMLTDKEAITSAIEVLKEEDFYREDNKAIYGAILNLYNRAEPVDIITLKSELSSAFFSTFTFAPVYALILILELLMLWAFTEILHKGIVREIPIIIPAYIFFIFFIIFTSDY